MKTQKRQLSKYCGHIIIVASKQINKQQ